MAGCGSGDGEGAVKRVAAPRLTDLVSLFWNDIGSAARGFGATVPLDGSWVIRQVVMVLPVVPTPASSHIVEFRLGTNVPTTSAEFLAGEMVFPWNVTSDGLMRGFRIASDEAVVQVCGAFLIEPKGRRVTGRWQNNSGVSSDGYAALVIERV